MPFYIDSGCFCQNERNVNSVVSSCTVILCNFKPAPVPQRKVAGNWKPMLRSWFDSIDRILTFSSLHKPHKHNLIHVIHVLVMTQSPCDVSILQLSLLTFCHTLLISFFFTCVCFSVHRPIVFTFHCAYHLCIINFISPFVSLHLHNQYL